MRFCSRSSSSKTLSSSFPPAPYLLTISTPTPPTNSSRPPQDDTHKRQQLGAPSTGRPRASLQPIARIRRPPLFLRPRPLLPRRLAASAAAAAASTQQQQQQLDAAPTRADAEALLNGDNDDDDDGDEESEAEAVRAYVSYLNSEFGIPGLVAASVSPLDGGPQLELSHPPTGFRATVSLHGAVVTSLVRPGVGELLYLEDAHGNAVSASDGGSEEGGGRTTTTTKTKTKSKGPRRPLAFGVAPAFPMVGRSDGVAASSGASWAQLPPDGILRHAHWSVAASGAATVHKKRGGEGGEEGGAVENGRPIADSTTTAPSSTRPPRSASSAPTRPRRARSGPTPSPSPTLFP